MQSIRNSNHMGDKKKGKIECSSVMMSSDSGMVLSINIVTVTQPQISRSECLRCQKIIHFGWLVVSLGQMSCQRYVFNDIVSVEQ